jgi:hypothetical protein
MIRAIVILLLMPSFAFAQVKIEGPKEGMVGYRIKAKLTLAVDDPKIVCFPANDDWMGIQDFSGNKYIDFVPNKKLLGDEPSKLYTFVVAGNKAGKTFLETWEVTVKADEDAPLPPPKPKPEVSELYKSIRAVYMVNPDAEAKAKLITVYKQFLNGVEADSYASNSAAHQDLVKLTNSKLTNELKTTRDVVAAHFQKAVGQRPNEWDKAKTAKAIAEVIAVLEKL